MLCVINYMDANGNPVLKLCTYKNIKSKCEEEGININDVAVYIPEYKYDSLKSEMEKVKSIFDQIETIASSSKTMIDKRVKEVNEYGY